MTGKEASEKIKEYQWVIHVILTLLMGLVSFFLSQQLDVSRENGKAITARNVQMAVNSRETAAMAATLEKTSPNEVKAEVQRLNDRLNTFTTKEDIRELMETSAPWVVDKREWEQWRRSVDAAIERIHEAIKTGMGI